MDSDDSAESCSYSDEDEQLLLPVKNKKKDFVLDVKPMKRRADGSNSLP